MFNSVRSTLANFEKTFWCNVAGNGNALLFFDINDMDGSSLFNSDFLIPQFFETTFYYFIFVYRKMAHKSSLNIGFMSDLVFSEAAEKYISWKIYYSFPGRVK